jgi:hypothetical protein
MDQEILISTNLVDDIVDIVCDYTKKYVFEIDGYCYSYLGYCEHYVRFQITDRTAPMCCSDILRDYYVGDKDMRKHLKNQDNKISQSTYNTNGMILTDFKTAYAIAIQGIIDNVHVCNNQTHSYLNISCLDIKRMLSTLSYGTELIIFKSLPNMNCYYMKFGELFAYCIDPDKIESRWRSQYEL